MDKGIYTALSGSLAKSREIEVIANNLANANTPGFKKDTGTFNEYLTELRRQDTVEGVQREINAAANLEGRPQGDKSFVEMDGVYTDYRQGSLERTNRPLDVAVQGKGFFEVLTPQGVRYTRQGTFHLSNDGRLVTASGYPVLAKYTGALLPGQTAADVSPELRLIQINNAAGKVEVTPEGIIIQGGNRINTIALQEFHEEQWLEKLGNGYYRNTSAENVRDGNGKSQLHQGFVESSNVNPVREMTKLIEATRAYESHMQAIRTYQEVDGKSVNEIANPR